MYEFKEADKVTDHKFINVKWLGSLLALSIRWELCEEKKGSKRKLRDNNEERWKYNINIIELELKEN